MFLKVLVLWVVLQCCCVPSFWCCGLFYSVVVCPHFQGKAVPLDLENEGTTTL